MCGILGLVKKAGYGYCPDVDALRVAANYLRRRGPDDFGIWTAHDIVLVHRRLAVLELTEAGHQPMESVCGRFVIVFNGEVYNHLKLREQLPEQQWRGHSDTETILAAYRHWGVECLHRFQGMFAFAIWDTIERRLFAARDRMGVKPFYYHHDSNVFAFASRPRALFSLVSSLSDELSPDGLRYYLQCGYFPAERSVYASVRKLPPAHYMVVHEGQVTIRRYWGFQDIMPEKSWQHCTEEGLVDELDEVLSNSVRSRMISDVPLGAFLSGGIDSSLVVAMMARHGSGPIKTFTIGFEEPEYDESAQARMVAEHLGTEHHSERLRIDDLLELMPVFTEEFDEPFFDHSAFPMLAVSRLARQHVTVALSGDGGDELFGGYHYYQIVDALQPFFRLPRRVRHAIAGVIGVLPRHRAKLLAGALREPSSDAAFAFSRSISKDFDGLLLPEANRSATDIRTLFAKAAEAFPCELSAAERGMRLDAMFTLPDDYLQKVDVASMAFSLEAREPMLDHAVVEWAMRLPVSWKLRQGTSKYLLRKLARRYIPAHLIDRPKQGFGAPIDRWLRGPLSAWARDLLHESSLFEKLPLSQQRALELFNTHQSGARNVSSLLWALLMLLNFVAARPHREG